MQRATNYSMDLNAIGIGETSPELKLDMYCPQVGGGSPTNPNWSRAQCVLRVRVNNPCIAKCAFGKKLKAEMDAIGKPYVLEVFTGVAVGEKTKRKVKTAEVDPNDRWTGRNQARDMRISIDLAEGSSVASLAKKHGVSKTAIRKAAYRYFSIANPRVFLACPEHMSRTEFAQINKNLFLPFLVFSGDGVADVMKGI